VQDHFVLISVAESIGEFAVNQDRIFSGKYDHVVNDGQQKNEAKDQLSNGENKWQTIR
jgi:hypothetical protein